MFFCFMVVAFFANIFAHVSDTLGQFKSRRALGPRDLVVSRKRLERESTVLPIIQPSDELIDAQVDTRKFPCQRQRYVYRHAS